MFRRITLFCFEKRLSKHKMTIFSTNLEGGMAPLPLPWLRLCFCPTLGNFLRTPLFIFILFNDDERQPGAWIYSSSRHVERINSQRTVNERLQTNDKQLTKVCKQENFGGHWPRVVPVATDLNPVCVLNVYVIERHCGVCTRTTLVILTEVFI